MTHQKNVETAGSDNTDQLIALLDGLQPSKQQKKTLLFQKLFPGIERALDRNVPQKTILVELQKMNLSLSMGGFRTLLENEKKLRIDNGERMQCETCGSTVSKSKPTLADLIAPKESNKGDANA